MVVSGSCTPSGTAITGTWYHWNVNYDGTASASSSSSDGTSVSVWLRWNDDYTTNTVTTPTYVSVNTSTGNSISASTWFAWNGSYWEVHNDVGVVEPAVPETPEQLAARQVREAEARRQAEERTRIRQEAEARAEARAEAILTEHLSQQQREEFGKDRSFTVISKDGQRRYRIKKGYSRNIERLDDCGKRLKTLCAHPVDSLPDYDHMLAQKLMLEHDEDRFLAVANVS